MPSWQGQFFNAYIRRFVRRRYGRDDAVVAGQARKLFGAPRFWQWLKTRDSNLQTVDEKGVRGEWIEAKEPAPVEGVIFYLHGGGYISCSARTHRPITATLARLARVRVFALDYRLAPEARFPAALDDTLDAYHWLVNEQNISPERIALAGDSAGGGLVLSLLMRLREENLPLPACAACFSPWTDLAGTGKSIQTNATRDAMFYPENIAEFASAYLGAESAKNPLASPVYGDFSDLPPVLFHVGSTEILLDDARRIHQKIQAADGAGELKVYEDIFHCWQMGAGLVPEANDSLNEAAAFIRRHIS
jgi:monoterpene epsilon-lactone hydrolase